MINKYCESHKVALFYSLCKAGDNPVRMWEFIFAKIVLLQFGRSLGHDIVKVYSLVFMWVLLGFGSQHGLKWESW